MHLDNFDGTFIGLSVSWLTYCIFPLHLFLGSQRNQ